MAQTVITTRISQTAAFLAAASALCFLAPAPAAAQSSSSPPGMSTASPAPTATPVPIADQLGRLDALAQQIVVDAPRSANAQSASRAIGVRWPAVRAGLVGAQADRSDLLAADSAIKALATQRSYNADLRRAGNVVTAAFAPLYTAAGDRVPAQLHRLDFLTRAIGLDVSANDWVRSTRDLISARSSWRNGRAAVVAAGGSTQAHVFDGRLAAVADAVNQRDHTRSAIAVRGLDSALAAAERTITHQEPAWRRFVRAHFHV